MSRTLTVPDSVYERLDREAKQKGLSSVEQLLETWRPDQPPEGRTETVRQIDELRSSLYAKYGQMEDSVDLIREDRER